MTLVGLKAKICFEEVPSYIYTSLTILYNNLFFEKISKLNLNVIEKKRKAKGRGKPSRRKREPIKLAELNKLKKEKQTDSPTHVSNKGI